MQSPVASKIKLRQRLSYRQAMHTVVVALLLGLFLSAIQIGFDLFKERKKADSTVLQIINIQRDSAARSVYDYDEIHARNVISGLFEYQPIRKVQIFDEYGKVFSEKKRVLKVKWDNRLIRMIFEKDKKYEVPLQVQMRHMSVGKIVVTVDSFLVAENFISRSVLLIFSGIIRNFVLALVLTLMFYYTLTKPILTMERSLSAIDINNPGKGLLGVPPHHEKDEFGLLVSSINLVLEGFGKSLTGQRQIAEELRKSEMKYRTIFENSISGIFQTTPQGRFLTANPAMAQICGYETPKELTDQVRDIAQQLYVNPKKRDEFKQLMAKDGYVSDFEFQLLRKDNSVIIVVINAHRVLDRQNGLHYYEGIMEDITQRKKGEELIKALNRELEQIVAQRTAELQAANQELESFSYSVSHDLRAPLRSLDGFSQALLEDYHDTLDDEGQDYLRRIRNASQKMGELIDDLLNLSRVTRKEMVREQIDVNHMAKEIWADLLEKDPNRKVEVLIQEDLSMNGDTGLVRLMLQNLIGNAWKYTSKATDAKIELGCEIQNSRQVFYVKDNGAGFNMIYADKLFKAFNRLHAPEQFDGTGIGLAIVNRVINRHGGTIWAEAKENEGAIFYFAI